jgi:hypothetical protein
MAVTLIQTPSTTKATPAYNENWFIAESDQTGQPNFKFTVSIIDVNTGTTWTEQIEPVYGTNRIYFDAGAYAEKYMVNFFEGNTYGWQMCTDAYRPIDVKIGETYGTPPTYYSGSNTTHFVWNAGLDTQTFAYYNADNYVFNELIPNYVFLTSVDSTYKVFDDRSNYLYFLGTVGNITDLPYITITTYDANGGFIGTSTIDRPSYSTGNYSDQYQCIDIGVKGLTNIPSGLVSGAYPIITSSVASYQLSIPASPRPLKLGTFTITCNPRYTVYTLHYLNQKGGYDTLHCNKVSEKTSTKTATTFKRNTWNEVSNVMTYNPSMMLEKTQGITVTDSLKLNSDWLTQEEFDRHRDLFASTDIRLDLGSSTPNIAVKITNGNYIQKNSDRLRMLSFDLSYTFNNHRQRG